MNHDLRKLPTFKHLCAFGLVLSGVVCSFQVNAQSATVGPNGFDRFMALTTGATTQTIGFGPGGTPVVTNTFAGGAKLGNMAAFPDSSGGKGLEFRGSGSIPVGAAGRTVPFAAVGKVSPVSLTKALKAASILAGGWPGVVLFAGIAAADWLSDSGLTIDPVTGEFYKTETTEGTVCGPPTVCYEYKYPGGYNYPAPGTWGVSAYEAASSLIGKQLIASHLGTVTGVTFPTGSTGASPVAKYAVYVSAYWGTEYVNIGITSRIVPAYDTSTVEIVPVTEQEAMEALQETYASAQLLSDLYNKNVNIDVENVIGKFQLTPTEQASMTTVPGPQVVTDTPAQNGQPATSKTVQTDYNCVFVMMDVTCDEKKTTTTTAEVLDPETGLPKIETTVTTETKEAEKPAEVKDPCIDHPKRNGCREDEFDTPDGEIPKSTVEVGFQAEDLGLGGGSCPADITMAINGKTTTVGNWASTCNSVTTYAKPLILILATFSALMIVMGVRVES